MRRLFCLLLLAAAPSIAQAQKNCKKGIPCGNSCIAANKTCRVGTPSTQPSAASRADSSAAVTSTGEWVGSSRGHTYYRAGCSGANKLAKGNLIYFKSEADAKKAGYTHSVSRGC